MKKILQVVLLVCLLLALLCGTATAASMSNKTAVGASRVTFLGSPSLYGASNLQITTDGLDAKLTWSPDNGSSVTGYVVFQCQRSLSVPSNAIWWTHRPDGYYWYPVGVIGTTTNTYMNISANKPGTYYIEVDSYYSSYNSYVSSHGEFCTFYATTEVNVTAPKTVKARQTAANKVKLTWTAGENAKSYVIYRRAGSGSYKKVGATTKLSWTDKNVKKGKVYQYGIVAKNGSKTDRSSTVVAYPMDRVSSVKIKRVDNNVVLKWKKVDLADKYLVYRKKPGQSEFEEVASVSSLKTTIPVSGKSGTYEFYVSPAVGSFTGIKSGRVSVNVESGTGNTAAYYALIVANTYSGNSTLHGTANDAKAVDGALKGLSQGWDVTVRKNVNADAILSSIYSTYANATEDDVCLFYYSGHGVTSSGTYSGALCGNNLSSYVTTAQLANALDNACPGQVIVLLDSCGSGASINKSSSKDRPENFTNAVISAFASRNRMRTNKSGELIGPKFTVLVAASAGTSSYDLNTSLNGYNCGAFTYSMLKAMGASYPNGSFSYDMPGDSNGDRMLTLGETYNSICNTVSYYGWDDEGDQCTQYYGDFSTILFERK